jgi:GNAT superfamily N-acetyltransferase
MRKDMERMGFLAESFPSKRECESYSLEFFRGNLIADMYAEIARRVSEENPNRNYPSERDAEERIRPIGEGLAGVVARSGENKMVGIVVGEDRGRSMDALRLLIDPKFQHSGVGEKLLDALKEKYSEITLLASAFGGYIPDSDESQEMISAHGRRANRQWALMRFYERQGFEDDGHWETYQSDRITGAPRQMIWRRKY